MGCQAEKAPQSCAAGRGHMLFSVLALPLTFTAQARKKSNQKGEESLHDKVPRMSSSRLGMLPSCSLSWRLSLLPTQAETGLACPVSWNFPPILRMLESRHGFEWLALQKWGRRKGNTVRWWRKDKGNPTNKKQQPTTAQGRVSTIL